MELPKIRYLTPTYIHSRRKDISRYPYDTITRGRPFDMLWIMENMPLSETASILEFGAWPADNWRVAKSRWNNLLVTDSFTWESQRDLPGTPKRKEWQLALDEAGVSHSQLDVQNMNYHEFFDGIFSISVLEHVVSDRIALVNIRNALKPNGLFVFTVELNPYVMMDYNSDIFFRVYSQEVIVKMLADSGFEVNKQAEDFSDFENTFRINDPVLLREPYKHFVSAGIVAKRL